MTATLGELAARVGCELRGEPGTVVTRVGTLANAADDAVTFLANPLYRDQLAATRAAAVVLESRYAAECPAACLVTGNPYATYARIAAELHPPRRPVPGVSAQASVAEDARVPASAEVGPQAVIGARAVLGEHVIVGAGAVVGADANVGDSTRIGPRAAVLDGVRIGRRCVIHGGAVLGADGFGFAFDDGTWTKVPQLGGVWIGDDVEIGANTTVDRGTIEDTVIEDGVKIDNLVQIAHNVRIGEHTVMAAMSGAAGSTKIGRRCRIGGGVVMVNQIEICDDAMFTFRSVVTKSVMKPGVYGGSLAAEDAAKWRRNAARFRRLDALAERVAAMERELRGLKEQGDD